MAKVMIMSHCTHLNYNKVGENFSLELLVFLNRNRFWLKHMRRSLLSTLADLNFFLTLNGVKEDTETMATSALGRVSQHV